MVLNVVNSVILGLFVGYWAFVAVPHVTIGGSIILGCWFFQIGMIVSDQMDQIIERRRKRS